MQSVHDTNEIRNTTTTRMTIEFLIEHHDEFEHTDTLLKRYEVKRIMQEFKTIIIEQRSIISMKLHINSAKYQHSMKCDTYWRKWKKTISKDWKNWIHSEQHWFKLLRTIRKCDIKQMMLYIRKNWTEWTTPTERNCKTLMNKWSCCNKKRREISIRFVMKKFFCDVRNEKWTTYHSTKYFIQKTKTSWTNTIETIILKKMIQQMNLKREKSSIAKYSTNVLMIAETVYSKNYTTRTPNREQIETTIENTKKHPFRCFSFILNLYKPRLIFYMQNIDIYSHHWHRYKLLLGLINLHQPIHLIDSQIAPLQ